jgi:hypothetical protein
MHNLLHHERKKLHMSMTDHEMRQMERRIEEKFDSLRKEIRSLDWSITKVFIAVLGLAPIVVFTYIVVLSLIPSKR